MGKTKILMGIVGSFDMQFLRLQERSEYLSLKTTIVGFMGSLLEL
jgi:hypothetical protein